MSCTEKASSGQCAILIIDIALPGLVLASKKKRPGVNEGV
jgi:hypothetical protein